MDQQPTDPTLRITKRMIISGLIILVLIIAGAAILNIRYNEQKAAKNDQKGDQNNQNPVVDKTQPQYAPEGKLVSGFPEALLAGSESVEGSYKREYDSQNRLLAADFGLNRTEKEAYDFYTKFLTDNNYNITNKSFAQKFDTGTISNLYGRKDNGEQLNIVIVQRNKTDVKLVEVSILYTPAK
jgi:hypothetical protein